MVTTEERCRCGAPAPDDNELCDRCERARCAHCSDPAVAFGMCADCGSACETCMRDLDPRAPGSVVLRGLDDRPRAYHARCAAQAALELVTDSADDAGVKDGLDALAAFIAAKREEVR